MKGHVSYVWKRNKSGCLFCITRILVTQVEVCLLPFHCFHPPPYICPNKITFLVIYYVYFNLILVAVQYYKSFTIWWFTILKGYTLFIVIIKYWLYSLCYTIYPVAYFVPYSLCLLLLYPFFAPRLFSLPRGNHWFVFYIVLTSLLWFLDSIYKWYHVVFDFPWMTYFT